MISANVIEDSVSTASVRLTTLELEYPRFIHSEFMTHRVFSRNASSSRAIPISKMIERVINDPAMPVYWGSNQPGMQAGAEIDPVLAREYWIGAAKNAVEHATLLNNIGLHKQVVNRVLEPFSWIKVLVTSTDWENFFELRDHEDAQPEIRKLAREIRAAIEEVEPSLVRSGEWHMPYVGNVEKATWPHDELLKVSAARCARVSYLNHDQSQPDLNKDLQLFERLAGSKPIHASPLEHQATPASQQVDFSDKTRNFRGWQQFRALYGA